MQLSGLLSLLLSRPAYQSLLTELAHDDIAPAHGKRRSLAVPRAARPFVVAALAHHLRRPVLLVVGRPARAVQMHGQLRQWLSSSNVHYFAEPDALPYEKVPWSSETRLQRLNALTALASYFAGPHLRLHAESDEAPVVVATARALLEMTVPRREFVLGLRSLRVGQTVTLSKLVENWIGAGYRQVELVEEPATFSRRGGIIDLYPPNERWPIRIELFGDEIESMRYFDPSTQRSIEPISHIVIAPATEALPKFGPVAAERLRDIRFEECPPLAEHDFRDDLAMLEVGQMVREMEFYIPYLYSHPGRLLDFLPDRGLLIIESWGELRDAILELLIRTNENRETAQRTGDLPSGWARALRDWDEEQPIIHARADLELDYGEGEAIAEGEAETFGEMFSHPPHFGGRLKQIVSDCYRMARAGDRVILASRQAKRLVELFRESSLPVSELEDIRELPASGAVYAMRGILSDGWVLSGDVSAPAGVSQDQFVSTVLLTDTELFGWSKPAARVRRKTPHVTPDAFFADVSPGDYVVHIEHGIGIYRGLVKLSYEELEREYLLVEYAAGDRLYVPVHQADRLTRYVGAGETGPKLNRLGTSEWESIKAKTKEAVKDIARELLQLYAQRATVQGHAFQPDTPWQRELEEALPYIETVAQLAAIEDVKADMEQPRPMDRLVCGDVGYGKTEVALRSAFKAVMDGKQVAVLVPTTVLAQQHFKRFGERLAAFPVNVEMLSRFRSEKDQERILRDLANGTIDIIIGTHRLIQKDVRFKDLGLVIIDEEQRFGVAHKERLKQLRHEVDVLTLTATPIPRTLHMSLVGVRDLSTIDTPPEERLPIKTVLAEYDDTLVRQAILRELERGGQVYFVHNRVRGIEVLAKKLQALVPEAIFAIAHGQMPEKDLAEVMWNFANGEADVLVCTTIIESGIDIPNVNTIIIHRADRFGLSQLYQLRGRVGRGAVRAYAYLLYDRNQPLSEVARRRLQAIVDANELGAGFRIAMEDLEIRGAGELLGARQHGHIAAVGLDLYSRLLAEAIQELQNGSKASEEQASGREKASGVAWRRPSMPSPLVGERPNVLLDLPLAAYVPAHYISEEALRLQIYRRMAEASTHQEVEDIALELRDRFGPPPEEVQNLLFLLRLKASALKIGIQAIVRDNEMIIIRYPGLEQIDREALQRRLGNAPRVARRQIMLPLSSNGEWRDLLEQVITELSVAS